jgi:hypothetical protein
LPSLNQWITGKGELLTWHLGMPLWVRTTETSFGELAPIMEGGTWTKTFYHENLWLSTNSWGTESRWSIILTAFQDLNVKNTISQNNLFSFLIYVPNIKFKHRNTFVEDLQDDNWQDSW